MRALLPLLPEKADRTHLEDAQAHYQKARKGLDDLAKGEPGKMPIHPQYLSAMLDRLASDDAIFTCDGGLAMLMGELLTLRQLKAPVKIIVYQNDALSFMELEMKAAGVISFGTDLVNPDFARLDDACGIFGRNVEDPEELEESLRAAFDHRGPALVSVKVVRLELSLPPTIDFEQAKGFGIYLIKAMLNGRGSEILDLAKTNLREVF
ncbi:MAG TPA: thiamine pyrophosphate-dependent enzyme [Candidatus Acidoferrum sp.]